MSKTFQTIKLLVAGVVNVLTGYLISYLVYGYLETSIYHFLWDLFYKTNPELFKTTENASGYVVCAIFIGITFIIFVKMGVYGRNKIYESNHLAFLKRKPFVSKTIILFFATAFLVAVGAWLAVGCSDGNCRDISISIVLPLFMIWTVLTAVLFVTGIIVIPMIVARVFNRILNRRSELETRNK